MPRSTPRRSDRTATRPRTSGPAGGRGLSWLAWGALAAAALGLFVQLVPQAARAVLNTDECFHAHLARAIAAHGSLPARIPELYGGLFYSYPPLLHLLGAVWVKTLGLPTLPLLNVVLLAALMAVLAALPVPRLAATPRRWALWIVIANAALATYAVRFYAEMLTCLLGLLVALLLVRVAATRSVRDAVLLGIAGGLALLAKNTALLIPVLFAAYAATEAIARRPDGVRNALIAVALALVIAAPMLIRNQLLFGSPIYPGGARDVDPWLMQLNQQTFGSGLGAWVVEVIRTIALWALGVGIIGLGIAIASKRRDLHAGLLVCSILGIAIAPFSPLHDARHVMPLIAILALSGSVVIHDALAARTTTRGVIEYALAAIALVSVVTLGDRRTPLDVRPDLMEAYAAIHERVPTSSTVLSLWTYDTFYHSERAATWPIPWGQGDRSPAPLFREQDPERFLAELDRLGIEWLLVPNGPGRAQFNGANYPRSFVSCVRALGNRGALEVAWGSNTLTLLRRRR